MGMIVKKKASGYEFKKDMTFVVALTRLIDIGLQPGRKEEGKDPRPDVLQHLYGFEVLCSVEEGEDDEGEVVEIPEAICDVFDGEEKPVTKYQWLQAEVGNKESKTKNAMKSLNKKSDIGEGQYDPTVCLGKVCYMVTGYNEDFKCITFNFTAVPPSLKKGYLKEFPVQSDLVGFDIETGETFEGEVTDLNKLEVMCIQKSLKWVEDTPLEMVLDELMIDFEDGASDGKKKPAKRKAKPEVVKEEVEAEEVEEVEEEEEEAVPTKRNKKKTPF